MTKSLALLSVALLLALAGCATGPHQQSVPQLKDTGEKYLAAGETADALRYLSEAAQKKPDDPSIQYDLALAYDERGWQDKAFTCLQNALKIKPDYSEAQNAIGTLYAGRGQYKLAQVISRRRSTIRSTRPPSWPLTTLGVSTRKKAKSI